MQDEQPAQNQAPTNWQFNPEGGQVIGPAPSANQGSDEEEESISWTASEFIAHDKDMAWFALLGVGAAVLLGATYLLTQDLFSTIVVSIMVISFAAFAVRKPRTLPYRLDDQGLHIDKKTYYYGQFKSFSMIQEGGVRSLQLMPLKRVMPPLNIYMDPADEDRIIDVLANYLPMEPREQDMIDRLMRRLRF